MVGINEARYDQVPARIDYLVRVLWQRGRRANGLNNVIANKINSNCTNSEIATKINLNSIFILDEIIFRTRNIQNIYDKINPVLFLNRVCFCN